MRQHYISTKVSRIIDISVADIRGGRDKDDNSSVRLDHLLTTEAHATPTLFT